MVQLLLLLTGALVVGAIVFGVAVLIGGGEGLGEVEPDGRSVPLPGARPLAESDFKEIRFDVALRGYRMAQVDHVLKRAAYDIGYKTELIQVLEAEVIALREGRMEDANALQAARQAALGEAPQQRADGSDHDTPLDPEHADPETSLSGNDAGSAGAGSELEEEVDVEEGDGQSGGQGPSEDKTEATAEGKVALNEFPEPVSLPPAKAWPQ